MVFHCTWCPPSGGFFACSPSILLHYALASARMTDSARILERLREQPERLDALVTLTLDHLLERPLGELVDAAWLGKAMKVFQLVTVALAYVFGFMRIFPEYLLGISLFYALVGFGWGFLHRRLLSPPAASGV